VIIDRDIPDSEKSILPLVQALFPESVPIKFVPRVEGMKINSENEMPSLSIGNLLHEIGHLIDIDDARASQWGWGVEVPRARSAGSYVPAAGHAQGCRSGMPCHCLAVGAG